MHLLALSFSLPALIMIISALASIPLVFGAVIASAQPAINTLLRIGTQGSPTVFATIANVGDITGPGFKADVVDVTSHSNSNPWRQKITTLLDNGDVSMKLFFIPSSAGTSDGTPFGHDGTNGLLSVFTGRQLREYSITFPDPAATTWYFQAYVSKFSMTSKVAGVLEADVTFTTTGEPILV